jgi:uncharacterized protein (DUF924 family)
MAALKIFDRTFMAFQTNGPNYLDHSIQFLHTKPVNCMTLDREPSGGDYIDQITDFWLDGCLNSPEAAHKRRDWWYGGDQQTDDEIRSRFGTLVSDACAGGLQEWEASAEGCFGLILLLDQFTRNLGRGTIEAYAGDKRAFAVVRHAIEAGLDRQLHPVSRIWLYHPFHHSEVLAEQDQGLSLLHQVKDAASPEWHAYVERSITGWTGHRDIVAQYSRFPHRNKVLGRTSTPAELDYIANDGRSFGQ